MHGVLLLAAAANVDWRRQPRPTAAVSIKATVMDMSVFDAAVVAPPTQVEPDPPEESGEREAQAQQAEREREAREAEQQRLAAEAERQRQADEAARKRQADEAERKRQADEAERKRQAEEAERKRQAEEAERKRKAEEKAARERREREAQLMAQAERENLMREQMEFETKRRTAVDSGLMAQYVALVQQKIVRNWNRPPSAREGLECRVSVKQIPGGEVVAVKILSCNGDQAVERSIEAAIRKASPLPDPPDPTLFQRDLEILFVPQ